MVELSSHPNTEFSSSWKDSESLRNIPDCPALKIQFIDGINCSWRKCSIVVLLLIPRVHWLGCSGIWMRKGSIRKFVIKVSYIQEMLVRQVNLVLLILKSCLILLIIHLLLQKFSILSEGHLLVFEWQLLKLSLKALLLLIIIRKFINEFVHVSCDGLMIQKLVFLKVPIFNSRINLVICCVISIIRKKTFALILMEAK